jgi:small subunit ribosomal protein S6
MPLYEHVFLARPDVTVQQVDAMVEQFKTVITTAGGSVPKTEYWGLKTLAYRMRKNRKAHFTMLNLDAAPAAIAEMERLMRINEDILRFMTLRIEQVEEGPSAMMRRRDDGDRRRDDGERRPRRDDGEGAPEAMEGN